MTEKPPKTRKSGRTLVRFPEEWAALSFEAHQKQVVADDYIREDYTSRVALRVRFIHDTFFVDPSDPKGKKRPPRHGESGHETFKDWCESLDKTDRWGLYMVKAAEQIAAGRAENPTQARALSGLEDKDADAVSEAAQQAGPVTGKTLTDAREELERRRNATVTSNRQAAKAIEDSVKIRKAVRWLKKARDEVSGIFPEEFFTFAEKWIAFGEGQLALDAA